MDLNPGFPIYSMIVEYQASPLAQQERIHLQHRSWRRCRFITCNKYTTLVGGLDNGGGYAYLPWGHKELDTTEVTKHAGTHKRIWGAGIWEISPSRWLSGKESTCTAGDTGSIPGLGRSSGVGNGNTLQYSCLENPMDRGAWQATVYRFAKSQTQLK